MAYKSIGARSAVSNNVSNPTSLAGVAYPTPRATGDLLLCITTCRSITATASMSAPWQVWTGFPKRSATASGGSIYVFWREDDGIASSAVVTWTGVATGTTGDSSQAVILCFSNADMISPSDVTPPAPVDASASGPSLPDTTQLSARTTVVGIGMKVIDSATTGTITAPYIERGDFHTTSGTGHHLYVATIDMTFGQSYGAWGITESPTTAARCLGVVLAVKSRPPLAFPRTASDTIVVSDSAGAIIPPKPDYDTVIDNFTRANGLIDAGAGAAIWNRVMFDGVALDPQLRTIGNMLGLGTNGYQSSYTKQQVQKDFDVLINCITSPSNEVGLFVISNPGASFSGWALYWASGQWILRRFAAGVNQGNLAQVAGPAPNGYTIWFRKRGSDLKLYSKRYDEQFYSIILSATNAVFDSPGVIAIELNDTAARFGPLRGGPIYAPAAPTYETIIDDFNRADGKVGATGLWVDKHYQVDAASDLRVISNQLASGGSGQSAYTVGQIEGANCDVLIDCQVKPTNDFVLVPLLTQPGPNYSGYEVVWSPPAGTNIVTLNRIAGGGSGSLDLTNASLAAGDTLWFRKRGADVKLYRRPSGGSFEEILSATDPAPHSPANGAVGVFCYDTTGRWGNLRGGPLVVTADPPTASVVDDFNRANQYPPGSAWTGSWNVDGFRVVNNQLVNPSGGWDGIIWNATPAVDQECYITTAGIGADSSYLQLWARRNNVADTGYYLNLQAQAGAETWTIMRRISGADVGVGSPVSRAVAAGDTVGFKVVGSKIEMWHRPSGGAWALVLAETDTQITDTGVTGIYSNNPGWVLDDWGGPAVAGPVSLPRTASDSVAISDSAVRAPAPRPRTAADSWVNSDSATRAPAARVRPVTDVVALSDAAVRTAGARARTATDSWTRSDTAARAADTRLRPATDSVTLSDSAIGTKVVVRGASDTWSTADIADRATASRARGATDSWARADTATRAASTRIRPAVDVIIISDVALRAAAARVRGTVDIFSIDDNAASVTQATQGKTATDSWAVADTVTRGPSGAPAFSPADMPGLAVWLDAAQVEDVSVEWANLGSSPNGVVIGAPSPELRPNTLNNLPVVRFIANQGRIRFNGTSGLYKDYTVVYVGRCWDEAAPGRVLDAAYAYAGPGGGGNLLFGFWTNKMDVGYSTPAFFTPDTSKTATTEWKLYSGDCDTPAVKPRLFSDGVFLSECAAPPAHDGFGNTLNLSGYDATGANETGSIEIAEVVAFNRKLSDIERQQVENYLREKWFGAGAPPAGAPMFTRTAVDAVAVSDSATRVVKQTITAADNVVFSDAVTSRVGVSKTASDAWSNTDIASRAAATKPRTAADSWTRSDFANRAASTRLRGASDAVTLSDTLSRTPSSRVRTAVDSWSTSDTAASITIGGSIKSALDTVVFSDVALRAAAARSRTAVDSWVTSDSTARTSTRPRAAVDTWASSDSATRLKIGPRSAVDTVVTSDLAVRAAAVRPRTATDSVTFSDTSTRIALHPGRTAVDNWIMSDAVTVQRALKRPTADAFSVTDTVSRGITHQRQTVDIFVVSDTAQRKVSRPRFTADSWTSSDTVQASGSRARITVDTVIFSDVAGQIMRAGAAPQMTMML